MVELLVEERVAPIPEYVVLYLLRKELGVGGVYGSRVPHHAFHVDRILEIVVRQDDHQLLRTADGEAGYEHLALALNHIFYQ